MERTAAFHHEITDAVLPQPDPVFRDAAALDAAVKDMVKNNSPDCLKRSILATE